MMCVTPELPCITAPEQRSAMGAVANVSVSAERDKHMLIMLATESGGTQETSPHGHGLPYPPPYPTLVATNLPTNKRYITSVQIPNPLEAS